MKNSDDAKYVLGIIIGILSVTLMGTLISGLDKSFENSIYDDI